MKVKVSKNQIEAKFKKAVGRKDFEGLDDFGKHLVTMQNHGRGKFRNFSIMFYEKGFRIKYRKTPEIKMDFDMAKMMISLLDSHISKIEKVKDL